MEIEKKSRLYGALHGGLLRDQYWAIIVHTPTLYEASTGVWLLAYQHLTNIHLRIAGLHSH